MFSALIAAGMPQFADEKSDDGIRPSAQPLPAGDFEPTPATVLGARTVVTSDVSKALRDDPSTPIIDVGCGGAVIPGALWMLWVEVDSLLSNEGRTRFQKEIEGRTHGNLNGAVVVMGSGTYGWGSYNAALALVSFGYRNVLWYRGGEEAWSAAGLSSEDHRVP
jgi:3-mercaptopyruvate sulfurtransferase SseA